MTPPLLPLHWLLPCSLHTVWSYLAAVLRASITSTAAPPRVGQTTLGAAGRSVGRPSPEKAYTAAAAQSENGQPDRAF